MWKTATDAGIRTARRVDHLQERLRRELIALVEHMRGWATYRSRFPIWVTSVTNA